VVEFGAGEGENKEEEKGKDPVLEAQQIAKRILGYNSSDPGRLQSVYPRIRKYQQHFTLELCQVFRSRIQTRMILGL
jgi:hypothetical protein